MCPAPMPPLTPVPPPSPGARSLRADRLTDGGGPAGLLARAVARVASVLPGGARLVQARLRHVACRRRIQRARGLRRRARAAGDLPRRGSSRVWCGQIERVPRIGHSGPPAVRAVPFPRPTGFVAVRMIAMGRGLVTSVTPVVRQPVADGRASPLPSRRDGLVVGDDLAVVVAVVHECPHAVGVPLHHRLGEVGPYVERIMVEVRKALV